MNIFSSVRQEVLLTFLLFCFCIYVLKRVIGLKLFTVRATICVVVPVASPPAAIGGSITKWHRIHVFCTPRTRVKLLLYLEVGMGRGRPRRRRIVCSERMPTRPQHTSRDELRSKRIQNSPALHTSCFFSRIPLVFARGPRATHCCYFQQSIEVYVIEAFRRAIEVEIFCTNLSSVFSRMHTFNIIDTVLARQ